MAIRSTIRARLALVGAVLVVLTAGSTTSGQAQTQGSCSRITLATPSAPNQVAHPEFAQEGKT